MDIIHKNNLKYSYFFYKISMCKTAKADGFLRKVKARRFQRVLSIL